MRLYLLFFILTACTTPAQAVVILSPTSIIANSMGEAVSPAYYPLTDTINGSGLSTPFSSGSTDYSSYIGGSSGHTVSNTVGNFWFSQPGIITGSIIFDLGAIYNIRRLSIWQGGGIGGLSGPRGVNGITLDTSTNPDFGSFNSVGSYSVPLTAFGISHPANDFELIDSTGRYVRLNITSNHGDPNTTRIGEIAFGVTAVPEPSSILLLTIGVFTLTFRHRHK